MPVFNNHIISETVQHNNSTYGNNHFITDTVYEVNSEAVQEIMSKMPHWIIRKGTFVFFIIIMLLFTGAYFIHYPDVIVTKLIITSSNPAVKIIAQSSGRIQRLFVINNTVIKNNEYICLLENTANFNDMLLLKNLLNGLDTSLLPRQNIRLVSFDKNLQLGELQSGYADLYQAINQYEFFADKNFITQKVGQLQSQVVYQHQLNKELESRDRLLKQQLVLQTKKFMADSSLVKDKVIAPLEFDNSRKDLIDKQINAEATKSGILQNSLQQTEYLKTITDLQQQKLQQQNNLQQKIKETVKRLQAEWRIWEQKYIIKSPVNGKAVFFNVWKENQYVSNGEAVLMIVPPVQNYIARASLRIDGAGKVKPGQKVLIRLYSYPFEEFGMIRGSVANVSVVAMDTAFAMEVTLTNGLTTNINKNIPAQSQLPGIAEILTDDKNILERLFEKIWIVNKR